MRGVRRARVEMQVGDVEMNAAFPQRVERVDGVLGRAVGPIEIPHHQRIPGLEAGNQLFMDGTAFC